MSKFIKELFENAIIDAGEFWGEKKNEKSIAIDKFLGDGLEESSKGYVYPKKLDPQVPANYAKRAKYVENAVKSLDKALLELSICPKLDWMGDLASFSAEIANVVDGKNGGSGLRKMVKYYNDQATKSKKTGGKVPA